MGALWRRGAAAVPLAQPGASFEADFSAPATRVPATRAVQGARTARATPAMGPAGCAAAAAGCRRRGRQSACAARGAGGSGS